MKFEKQLEYLKNKENEAKESAEKLDKPDTGGASSSKGPADSACCALGLMGITLGAPSKFMASSGEPGVKEVAAPAATEMAQVPPWDALEAEIELEAKIVGDARRHNACPATHGTVAHEPHSSISVEGVDFGTHPFPAMPCKPTTEDDPADPHREKIGERRWPINAMVARPVGKKEIAASTAAQEAIQKEWDRLRAKNVWDETQVEEWDDVRKCGEAHMGYLFCICVEKNSELPDGHASKKYKGRVVFQGNRVVNQNWEAAMFQELGSSPATLEAARACDCYGCTPGNDCQIADAEQAYIQAEMKGTPTWVCLPPEAQPAWWKKKFRRPVCRLLKALYGHPDSGTFWEEHCDAHTQKVGFAPIGPTWPSCYFHQKLKLFLVIYVDDFKLSGLEHKLSLGWKLVSKGLNITSAASTMSEHAHCPTPAFRCG